SSRTATLEPDGRARSSGARLNTPWITTTFMSRTPPRVDNAGSGARDTRLGGSCPHRSGRVLQGSGAGRVRRAFGGCSREEAPDSAEEGPTARPPAVASASEPGESLRHVGEAGVVAHDPAKVDAGRRGIAGPVVEVAEDVPSPQMVRQDTARF